MAQFTSPIGADGIRALVENFSLPSKKLFNGDVIFFLNERHEIVHVSINKEESEAVPKRHRRKGT